MAIIKLDKPQNKECHNFKTYYFNKKFYTGRNPLGVVIMTRTEEGNIPMERKANLYRTIPKVGDIIYIDKEKHIRKFKVTGHILNTGRMGFRFKFLEAVFLEVKELEFNNILLGADEK